MSKPLSDDALLKALKNEGITKIVEMSGHDSARNKNVTWRDHDRNPINAFDNINGVVVHHTGSDAQGTKYVNNILWPGYAGLPGPLCHFGVGMDGTCYLISNGRANHAGGGDPAVLAAVQAEASWLMDREAKPTKGNSNGVDGNRHFYGIEVMYDGGQPMTAAQEDTTLRICAAILRAYGWSERSVIGHREWSNDKSDPGHENMVTFRKNVGARLKSGSKPAPKPPVKDDNKPKPAPKPSKPTVSLSKLIEAAKKDTARKQGGTTPGAVESVKIVEAALKKEGLLESKYASDGSFGGSSVTAYSKWQKKCGAVGRGADGIPGKETLTKLGNKYGFNVGK